MDEELEKTTKHELERVKKHEKNGKRAFAEIGNRHAARYGAVPHLMLSDRIFWSKTDHLAMAKALEDEIKPRLADRRYDMVASDAIDYLILTGSKCWSAEEQRQMAGRVEADLHRWVAKGNYLRASEYATRLRLLQAPNLVFTEGGVSVGGQTKLREQIPAGFNIDQEFGPGTSAFLEKASQDWIREELALKSDSSVNGALRTAVAHPILFGERLWGKDDDGRMKKELERLVPLQMEFPSPKYAAESAAEYLLLYGSRFWSEEEQQKMIEALRGEIEKEGRAMANTEVGWEHGLRDAVDLAVFYRVLSGESCWGKEDGDRLLRAAKKNLHHLVEFAVTQDRVVGYRVNAVREMLYYRILKAHELRHTDEGIKIIDN